jgi:transposase
MRKLQIEDAEVMRLAIQQEIERSDESRYDHRLHAVLLVANGHSCGDVARLFAEAVRTIQRWVRRFEQHGFEGLRDAERPGRPRSLDENQWKALARDLRRHPREFGLEQNLWDGKILGEHIKIRYGVTLGVRQCQRVFGKMGFRLRKPRPQVAQSDPVKVATVKKTAPSGKAQGH